MIPKFLALVGGDKQNKYKEEAFRWSVKQYSYCSTFAGLVDTIDSQENSLITRRRHHRQSENVVLSQGYCVAHCEIQTASFFLPRRHHLSDKHTA